MSTKALANVLRASLLILVFAGSSTVAWGQSSKLAVAVDKIERVGQNEARFRVTVTNTSAKPVFSTGMSFDSGYRSLDTFLEQNLVKEDWQLVAPCQDVTPPHVIQLRPAVPWVDELTLKVPLGRICKKRDIKLEGQFRFRVDIFESRTQAKLYLKKFFSEGNDKPRPTSAYSEPFEIPKFREPSEAGPNR